MKSLKSVTLEYRYLISTAGWIRSGVSYLCSWGGKGLDLNLYFMAKKYLKIRKVLKTKDILTANSCHSISLPSLLINFR